MALRASTPRDVSAEQEALAGLLLAGDRLFPKVRQGCPPLHTSHFWIEHHCRVFEACNRLTERGCPVDSITVCDELERVGHLEEMGGSQFMRDFWSEVRAGPALLLDWSKAVYWLIDRGERRV